MVFGKHQTPHSYLVGYSSAIRGDMKIVGFGSNIRGVDTPFRDDSRVVEIEDSYFFLSLSQFVVKPFYLYFPFEKIKNGIEFFFVKLSEIDCI